MNSVKEDGQTELGTPVGHGPDDWAPEQNQLQLATATLHAQANNVSHTFPDSNIVVGLQSGKTLHWYWYINGPEGADNSVREKIKSNVQEVIHEKLNSMRLRRSDLDMAGSTRRADIKHEMVQFLQNALDSGVISRMQLSALLGRLVGEVEPQPGMVQSVPSLEDHRPRQAKRQRSTDPHTDGRALAVFPSALGTPMSVGLPGLPPVDQVTGPMQPAEELAQELNRRCFALTQQASWDHAGRLPTFSSPQVIDDKSAANGSNAERTALSSEQRSLLLALIAKHAIHSENYTSAVIQEFHDVYPNVQVKAGYIRKLKCKNTKLPPGLPPNSIVTMGSQGMTVINAAGEAVTMGHLGESDGEGDMQDGTEDDPQVSHL